MELLSNLSDQTKQQTQGWPTTTIKHIRRSFIPFSMVILHCLRYILSILFKLLGIEKLSINIAAYSRKMHFKFRKVVTAPFAPNWKI